MKRMVKIASVVVLATSLFAVSFAQGAGPKGGAPKEGQHARGPENRFQMLEKVLNQLDLNKDQKSKIKDLIKKTRDELKDVRKDAKPGADGKPDPAVRDKVRGIMKTFHEDLFKILTPAQQDKFKQLMKDEMKKNGGPGGPRGFQSGPRG